MVGTLTMEKVWRYAKRATELMPPIPEDLKKVFAELKICSAAEILSTSKNH